MYRHKEKDSDHRNRREGYSSQDYVGGHSRSEDYVEGYRRSRPDYRSYRHPSPGSRQGYMYQRDYKGKWASREPSRSPSPYIRTEGGIAGLIFMCNKKTQRRCLQYHVLGMPMAKKRLAEQISPGMKLFLFEFESRDLYGVYEASSYAEVDLEPKAFLDAEIDFPLQVRFRIVDKCPPLRESEFKDAIYDNYYAAHRFKFSLTKEQVSKLLRLFRPAEPANGSRTMHYTYANGSSSHDNHHPVQETRVYREEERPRERVWKEVEIEPPKPPPPSYVEASVPVPKSTYVEGSVRVIQGAEYPVHKEFKDTPYVPEYKHARYYDSTAKFGGYRGEVETWGSRHEDYQYTTVLEPLPPSTMHQPGTAHQPGTVHQAGTSMAPYGTIPPKYDLPPGYAVARSEVPNIPPEADRYWKTNDGLVQFPAEAHSLKPSIYGRQAIYGEIGNGETMMASKKPMVQEMEYIPQPVAPLQVPLPPQVDYRDMGPTYAPKPQVEYRDVTVPGYGGTSYSTKPQVEYRDMPPTYGSQTEYRDIPPGKVSYAYADDGIEKRYAVVDSADQSGYPISSSAPKERYYKRERSPLTPEGRYSMRSYTKRAGSYERMNVDSYEHKPYYRRSPGRYMRDSPERGRERKASVWDRVTINGRPRGRFNGFLKRRSDFSQDCMDEGRDYANEEPEESFVVDFKRRSKGNDHAGSSHHGDNSAKKKKIVRPDSEYSAGHG